MGLSVLNLCIKAHVCDTHLTKRGHSIKLTFLSSPIASKHSVFYTPRSFSLWNACYPEEICLERSNFGGCHFELYLTARLCSCDIIPSHSNLPGKNLNWLYILHKVSKMYFSKRLSTSLSSLLLFLEFGACLAQNHKYGSRAAITQSGS